MRGYRMIVTVLDDILNKIDVLDSYHSLIWTVRYSREGDFELYIPFIPSILDSFEIDNYLEIKDSDRTMIIEDREIEPTSEEGIYMAITGRSLESILDRRIVWKFTELSGKLEDVIFRLLNENVVNPEDPNRRIENFELVPSGDPTLSEIDIKAQYHGEDLYTIISELCSRENVGFKIVLSDDGKFQFSLYRGVDRSYDQTTNPYVVFSPRFENINNSKYMESIKNYKNVTLSAGEGSGMNRKLKAVQVGEEPIKGLTRREVFTDAGRVSTNGAAGSISDSIYMKHIEAKGLENLAEHSFDTLFDADADTSKTFKYGIDFEIGDIVQLENEFGITATSRITELIITQDMEGRNVFPTFVSTDQNRRR